MCPAAKCPRGDGSHSDNRIGTGSGTVTADRTTAAATGIPPRISARRKWREINREEEGAIIVNVEFQLKYGQLTRLDSSGEAKLKSRTLIFTVRVPARRRKREEK